MTEPISGDPFLQTFHALQPDVDVVVLPPSAPPTAPPPPTPAEVVRAAVEEARTALTEVLAGASGTQVTEFWYDDVETGTSRLLLTGYVPADQPVSALRELGDHLLALGWLAAPLGTPRPTLAGGRDELEVRAAVTEGSVNVQLTTRPVVLMPATRSLGGRS